MQRSDESAGLNYWLRCQVLVCALIIAIPAVVSIRFVSGSGGRRGSFKSTELWMPCLKNLNPMWLLIFRAFAFVSMAFLLYQTVYTFGRSVFYFYTQWTLTLVMVYFALATIVSANGCWKYSKKRSVPDMKDAFVKKDSEFTNSGTQSSGNVKLHDNYSQVKFDQSAGFWENLMQSIYQTCAGAVMLTDIVFWFLLLPFQTGDNFILSLLIGCMHSLNAFFLLVDLGLNSIPFPWHGFAYFVLWSISYVVFQWVLHAFGFTWYLSMALVHVPCYGLYALLVKAKDSVCSRLFPSVFRRVADEKKNT